LNAYRSELQAARPRIPRNDIDDQLQSSHNALLAWAEGMIFALQRGRYWEGRPPWLKPLRDQIRRLGEKLDETQQPPADASPKN